MNQTGPAKRKDNETISKHINYLIQNFPEFEQLYEDYSRLIKLLLTKIGLIMRHIGIIPHKI
ncbi:MAG: DUF2520 domain-containing protein [Saprospiraceae bacterium]|nr:DUF2520 domain-containing protein [Saprospiraceae bacterium]